jgi:hypothetical protein
MRLLPSVWPVVSSVAIVPDTVRRGREPAVVARLAPGSGTPSRWVTVVRYDRSGRVARAALEKGSTETPHFSAPAAQG